MGCGRIRGTALWLTAALLGAGSIAAAQQPQTGSGTNELSFLAADTDGDTLIDEAELGADQAKRFRELDTNGADTSRPASWIHRRAACSPRSIATATASCPSSR